MTSRSSSKSVIALVGVGNMGGAMARRLLGLGWPVRVCDVVASRAQDLAGHGATVCANVAQAVHGASVTIVAVVDAAQTREVLFGDASLATAVSTGHTVMLCPTLAPTAVVQFASELQSLGIEVIDAPMSGGPQRALDGSMTLMLAGAASVLSQHAALLQDLASQRHTISNNMGDAAKTKLVNNLAAGILLVGTAEVLALAQALGLSQTKTLAVMEQSSGQSWIGSDRMRRMLAGDLVPKAHMTLLAKDTRLAIEAADAVGFHGPLGAGARDVFAQACQDGLGDQDDGTLLAWLSRTPDAGNPPAS